MVQFYGACGVEDCGYCLPLFDLDNAEIPGTEDPEFAHEVVRLAGLCAECRSLPTEGDEE